MARPQPRKAKAPAQHSPAEGLAVVYRHPAGDVPVTISKVAKAYVETTVQRYGGLPDITLKFTLRPDGEYRLVGSSNSARPALTFPEEG